METFYSEYWSAPLVIGRALRGIRAGDKHLAWNDMALTTVPVRMN